MDDTGTSPLCHLFISNVVPNSSEAEAAQSELGQLQLLIHKLEKQQQLLRAVLSPLRRLPLEILGDIFTLALSGPHEACFREEVINLCLVCRTWRDAAFAIPQLWAHLYIDLGRTSIQYGVSKVWLDRSGGLPKSLTIKAAYHDGCDDREGCELANDALVKLLTEGPQLDHISLHCTSSNCFRNLVEMIKSQPLEKRRLWDMTRSLELIFYREWQEHNHPHENSIFNDVPQVTSFSLKFPSKDLVENELWDVFDSFHLYLPEPLLSRLTTLTLGCDWDGTPILHILKSCPNVETLTLDFNTSSISCTSGDVLFRQARDLGLVLPSVRILQLRYLRPGSGWFLGLLKIPLLLELDISYKTHEKEPTAFMYRYPPDDLTSVLLHFFQRSQIVEGLRRLRIHSITLPPDNLKHIFACTPSLTHLVLDDVEYECDIFSALGKDPGEEIYLPNLDTLEFLHLPADFPLTDLLNFVKARLYLAWTPDLKEPVCQIKKLRISQRKPDAVPAFNTTYDAWLFKSVYQMDASVELV